MILAALLLLAFGTMKAQDTVSAPRKADTIMVIIPDMAELDELMRELNVNMQQIYDSVDWDQFERDMERWGAEMEKWGRRMEKWGERVERKYDRDYGYHHERPKPKNDAPNDKDKRPEKKNLLFDAHWNGFEAGLNMLLDPSAMNTYTGPHDLMAIRPMRSWYFGFNIADVGIAFNRKHTVGLFTGIGIGWNNYSWKNYIRMTVENNELVNTLLPDDRPVKNSKFGLLYAQVPLMIEVRPTPRFYIDFGVTGGIRLASWTRIKYADGENQKTYNNYLTNLFKCDASFRIGGENLGFFANYALVPTFMEGQDAAKAHPLMLGFSINF